MNQKYFLYAFGVDGDLTEIPNPTQSSGVVSYQDGYSSLYSEDPLTEGTALEVDRAMFNAVMYDVTSVLQNWQQWGSPEWITSTNNNGTAFSYGLGAMVRYSTSGTAPFTTYLSRVSNNTATPTEGVNWSQVATYSTVATETARAEAEEAVLASSISAETTRALAAEALLAPKAYPTFSGTVTLSGGVITQNGSGTNTFAGSITSAGNISASGASLAGSYMYAPFFETNSTGYIQIGTGASSIGGSLVVYSTLNAANGSISGAWNVTTLGVYSNAQINGNLNVSGALTRGGLPPVINNEPGYGDIILGYQGSGANVALTVGSTFLGTILTTNASFWPFDTAEDGYMTIVANGFRIAWGSGTCETGSIRNVQNLDIAFPGGLIFITGNYGSAVPPATGSLGFDPANAAQFFVINTAPAGGADGFWYIAIGF